MKMISSEELKSKMEEFGYYPTEELVFDTWNSLFLFGLGEINPGQDIFATCLEGPPGAGKTFYAKIYGKLAKYIYNEEITLVSYQCDATTGKTELYEDINISAAIRGDADHVNIPGKLIEAITLVNKGKKVILFIDEYDKAREETDAFLLDFLQSGKINSTQHGDLEIKDEYKPNLQVIFCKNDMREELSGPLSRRIRIIRLDYMKPDIFYTTANRNLVLEKENPVNEGLINMVALMYQNIYENKDLYSRLPACSEMLIALEDADRLLCLAHAPKYIIYQTIIKNIFKSLDDINTFEQNQDAKIRDLINDMKKVPENKETIDINSVIASKLYADQSLKLLAKYDELQRLIDLYNQKIRQLKDIEKSNKITSDTSNEVLLSNGKLVGTNSVPNVASNFNDSNNNIKRGCNIFELSENDWTEIATIKLNDLSESDFHFDYINILKENAQKYGIVIYENGILLSDKDKNLKLIVVKNGFEYKIMSNYQIIPSSYLMDIKSFIYLVRNYIEERNNKNKSYSNYYGVYDINGLIYDNSNLNYEKVDDNVYSIKINGKISSNTNFEDIVKLSCTDEKGAIDASNKIIKSKVKTKR